jgi:hypothetical protein
VLLLTCKFGALLKEDLLWDVQSVALVITTLGTFAKSSRFNPSAMLIGAACRDTRLGVLPLTSNQ